MSDRTPDGPPAPHEEAGPPEPPDPQAELHVVDDLTEDKAHDGENAGARAVVRRAVEATERLADISLPVAAKVRTTAGAAARRLRPANASRARDLRMRAREPLPNLFDVHPEARMAPRRDLGLRTIPVEEIRGTAVEGAAQRGRDFLPLPPFRGRNWHGRWRRIRDAVDRLAVLPPIEVLRTSDGYWVLDGHNRVAAALYSGQVDVDALVTPVRLPGDPSEPAEPVGDGLAALLTEADEVRSAAAGRLTPGASREAPLYIPPGPIEPEPGQLPDGPKQIPDPSPDTNKP